MGVVERTHQGLLVGVTLSSAEGNGQCPAGIERPEPAALTEEQRRCFERDGFLVVENALDPSGGSAAGSGGPAL